MNREKIKDSLRVSGKIILLSLCIYLIIMIFHLSYIGVVLLLTCLTVVLYVRKLRSAAGWWGMIKSLLQSYVLVTIIYVLSWLLGPYGFYGTLLIVLVLAGYKIIRRRDAFIDSMREVETQLWGRPMERKHWHGQKPPRLKLSLRKPKH